MKSPTLERESTIEFREPAKAERDTLKKLRKLEADEEASSIVYRDAKKVAASLKARKRHSRAVFVTRYEKDVFLNAPITFPMLFSRSEQLKMSRAELMTELSVIIDMSQPNVPGGQHLYSIQVLEPKDVTEVIGQSKLGEFLGGAVPPDLRSGYIYSPLLYQGSPFVRSIILENVLANATEIEVALRNPSTSRSERKRVSLR